MKIFFLATQSEFGGAQRYIYEIARSLDTEKYEILVAAGSGDGELFKKLENINIGTIRLKQMKRTPWPWQMVLSIKEIYNLLQKEKPAVLFLCSTTAGLLGSVAGFFLRNLVSNLETKFLIIYRIGGWAFRDPRPFWQNWLIILAEKLTAPLKDLIIVNSEYDWREAIKKRITSPQKIIKIYNGLDIDSLDFLSKEEARSALSLSDSRSHLNLSDFGSRLIVGCVANFYRTKGLEYLIEAFNFLRSESCPKATREAGDRPPLRSDLVIIGEGRLRPKLEALIKKYRLEDKVFLVGRIPDAHKYLKAFDIFVLPSLKEGFPWIILEAMAAELPIAATNVGALPEIIDNDVNGFLIPPKNSQALAEKLKWLLENPQEAKVMGIQAKAKLVKEFSLQKMVLETEKVLL